VVCAFLVPRDTPSRRLERLLDSNRKLGEQLDDFVCVKVDPRHEAKLVQQYRMQVFPVLFVMTPRGRPIKLVAGRMPLSKVTKQLAEALEKWEKVKNPWKNRPKARTRSLAPLFPPEFRVHPSSCPHECPACDPAAERGLAWLVGRQRGDGGWGKLSEEVVTKAESGGTLDRSIDHIDVALTSVAGLALLADGSTLTKGRHRARLARAVSFVRRHVRADGVLTSAGGRSLLALEHSNFETALGAMFLAEVLAQNPDAETRKSLASVARLLEEAQDPRSGGWGYSFDARKFGPNEKRGWRLLATTQLCLSALNAIRDAGIEVNTDVLQRGARYLRSCVNKRDDFTYRTETSWGKGHAGAAAGALYAISRAGVWDDATLERYRHAHRLRYGGIEDFGQHWWFSLLFTALAMNDAGEGSWVEAHEHFRDIVLHNQREDGSWDEPDGKAGRVFSTSIALFLLRFGRGNLPIASRRTGDRTVERVAKPRYLKPPNPTSRVKVFEHEGTYLADLIVSIDGPCDAEYLGQMETCIRGANRLLFDVTDGQMRLHQVRLLTEGNRWDEADVMVTTSFRRDESLPVLGAHGFTMVSKRHGDPRRTGSGGQAHRRVGQAAVLPGRELEAHAVASPRPHAGVRARTCALPPRHPG